MPCRYNNDTKNPVKLLYLQDPMKHLFTAFLTVFLLISIVPASIGQDDGGKQNKVKVKKNKKRGMGDAEDLDALNQDATQTKSYKQYQKKQAKKKKQKDKVNKASRKKAERKAARRLRKAQKKTRKNKRNYGRR